MPPISSSIPATPASRGAVASYSLKTVVSVAELSPDALELLNIHSRQTLQFGPDWFGNLERTVFTAGQELSYAVLSRSGQAVAVLPMLVQRGFMRVSLRSLGNFYTCLFEPATASDLTAAELAHMFTGLRQQYSSLGTLTLAPMDPDGPAFVLVEKALSLAAWSGLRYFCFGNWYLLAPKNWAEYLASRDGKVRSTIKRMTQRVLAEGGTVEVFSRVEDLPRALKAYETVYSKSWKVPEPSPDFIPGLMNMCAAKGALRVGVVWLKGQPVAAQFWIVSGQRAEIYKVAYDEAYKAFSPGTVLTTHLLKHVFEVDRVSEVDYLIGDDVYKKSWMSHRRERWGLIGYNRRAPSGLLALAIERAKRAIKTLLRRQPSAAKA